MGVPFAPAIAAAWSSSVLASMLLERLLYRRLYGGDELDQVLLTIGLVFMSVAAAKFVWGPLAQPFHPPPALSRPDRAAACASFPTYRSFLIASGAVLVTALWLGLERTRFGAQIRAAVDNRRMAQSVGINTSRLFTLAFALGSGLAALGGALGAEILAIEPGYALEHLIYFLIVVSVGGLGTHPRAVLRRAALRRLRHRLQISAARVRRVLHLCADLGHPAVAAARPVRSRMTADAATRLSAAERRSTPSRGAIACAGPRRCPGSSRVGGYFVFPDYLALGAQVLATILFALSLDLVLGYAGIVTLGHAAFFGTGAYVAGLLAAHGWGEPISGLLVAAAAAARGRASSAAPSSCARTA